MCSVRIFLVAASILFAACASPTAPRTPAGAIEVTGTVRYSPLEGGFWAVHGDDGVTYDPLGGLSPSFQRENMRVRMVGKIRQDMGGIHMVGPIVEIISIQPL